MQIANNSVLNNNDGASRLEVDVLKDLLNVSTSEESAISCMHKIIVVRASPAPPSTNNVNCRSKPATS